VITITIADLTNESPIVLRKLAKCLLEISGLVEGLPEPFKDTVPVCETSTKAVKCPNCSTAFVDNMNGNVPDHECLFNTETAADVFGTPAPSSVAKQTHHYTEPSEDADTAGVSYDSRIHSRTKSKNRDGTWKVKRGIKNQDVSAPLAPIVQRPIVPVAPVVPAAPTTPQIPAAPSTVSFESILARFMKAVREKKIMQEEVPVILVQADPKLLNMNEFAKHRDLSPLVDTVLTARGL
jgi:hypothetical protein